MNSARINQFYAERSVGILDADKSTKTMWTSIPKVRKERPRRLDRLSSNWSGYLRTTSKSGTFQSASGSWYVPTIAPSPTGAQVSIWIGIDIGLPNLIQAGIKARYTGTRTVYNAWYEVLPTNPEEIPLPTSSYPVSAGDLITGLIENISPNRWQITLENATKNWSFIKQVNYNGPGQTVEFIVERPGIPNTNKLHPLAHYGKVSMNPCFINARGANFVPSERVVMHDGANRIVTAPARHPNIIISTPSNPDAEKDGFTVAYGSTMPSPPPSTFIKRQRIARSNDRKLQQRMVKNKKRRIGVSEFEDE